MRAATRKNKLPADLELEGLVGWQGVTARTPADWNLGALGGDVRSGYLRVDDEHMPRLEIKWSYGKVDTNKVLTRYLGQLGKKTRRSSQMVVQRDTHLVSNRLQPGRSLQCFSWQGDRQQAHGLIWRCQGCQRTVIAQVLGPRQQDLAPLARAVLASLNDHDREGWYTWSLYGLAVDIPKEYELTRQQLMSGYLDLQFERGKRRLRVTRWGMAQLALRDRSLVHWVEVEHVKRRDVHWQAHALEGEEHPAALLAGERRRPLHWPRKQVARLLRVRAPIIFSGKVWHCAPSNRLFSVEEIHAAGEEHWPQVAGSIRCH